METYIEYKKPLGGNEMIHKVGQIMLYVNNQDEAVNFWTEKVGFHVVAEEDNQQGMRWIEIAPTNGAETSIILHNKFVEVPACFLSTYLRR